MGLVLIYLVNAIINLPGSIYNIQSHIAIAVFKTVPIVRAKVICRKILPLQIAAVSVFQSNKLYIHFLKITLNYENLIKTNMNVNKKSVINIKFYLHQVKL